MNITVTVSAPELTNALLTLASAINALGNAGHGQPVAAPVALPAAPLALAPAPLPVTPAPLAPAPLAPAAPAPAAVPTAPQAYTMDQLAVAATQLVDAGRGEELVAILTAFGVQALTQLPKEQYGNFATYLRSLGVRI